MKDNGSEVYVVTSKCGKYRATFSASVDPAQAQSFVDDWVLRREVAKAEKTFEEVKS